MGAAFVVHALADAPPPHKLAGIFLVAPPFIGPGGWRKTTCRRKPISDHCCLAAHRSFSITAHKMTSCRSRISICIGKRFRRRQ
jgi:predicted alpha/beta hydrolase family esterase